MTAAIANQGTRPPVDACRERQPFQRGRLPLLLAILIVGSHSAGAAVIPVTTTLQKISASGGCSLQEAIYSANFDANVAIKGYSGSTPIEVVTQCVPGSGDDVIVLPTGALLQLSTVVDDAINPAGPTATPIITSNITILANGATLARIGNLNFRLFTVGNTGHLTIRRAFIRGFRAQGGNGDHGGGGGLGAGGAIFVIGGTLVIEASTFQANSALGGNGAFLGSNAGGGGGGIGGSGGPGSTGGGGGGGARGNGGGGAVDGAGGGGTVSSGAGGSTGRGGFDCGGDGGSASDGHDGLCPGGGGGGGGDDFTYQPIFYAKNGGAGQYGGGGGGGANYGNGSGGRGGFGGGGGGAANMAPVDAGEGGDGGFGGGGGSGGVAIFNFNGDGGSGGFFAGEGGDGGGGGGGAGLGGAIFNDSGTVDIRNSTFTNGFVGGGFSGGSQDGSGGAGAIFSRNGHLTVLNSSISGNVANFGGGIMVVQDSASAPTSFVLSNTIIADNGLYECAISGVSIGAAFSGNLIVSNTPDGFRQHRETFVGCQGVVSSDDPQLGPLQYNQGATPTMAISSTSPARDAADPATSLPVDQRRQPRPANGGFDIGAFELCLDGPPIAQFPCIILAGIDPGEAVQLTVEVQPVAGGTTTPAPGAQQVQRDSVIPLRATPSPGFRFTGWSPNVTSPEEISTTVVMNVSQTVTANFQACACAADLSGSIGVTTSGPLGHSRKRSVEIVTLTNNSADTIIGPISLVLDNLPDIVTVSNINGHTSLMIPANGVYIDAPVRRLEPGQSTRFPLLFTNPEDVPFSLVTRVLAGPGSR